MTIFAIDRDENGGPDGSPVVAAVGFLNASQAASRLGVSERTIRRAIQRGEIPATRRGRRHQIAIAALEQFKDAREAKRRNAARPRLALVPFPAVGRPPRAAVPAPLTLFVGREREIAQAGGLLQRDDVRLVTLTGPGGVGKTRLSLRLAADFGANYADGARFVPLAAVHDPALVPSTIAVALDVRGGEEKPPWERLLAFLHPLDVLLVLDNFEQVLAAAPPLVDLLSTCPGLTLLVTSRSPLRISGERLFAVPPLALPDRPIAGHAMEVAELADVEAVRLFVDRAEAASADFTLHAGNAGAIAGICERADGLPLAIELAAARTALLSPAALLERLEPRLPLLTGGPRDQPDRLRTMRNAIAWSHDLLTIEERIAFRNLAVFAGGCTVEAAEAVVRVSPGTTVLDLVQRLVDQAVLYRGENGVEEPRVGMLETIREYGLEQLAAAGEETAARDAHAAWCLSLAERAEPELAGPDQATWVRRLEADMANIRDALDWLVAREETEQALRLGGAIGWLWSTAPYLEEARAGFERLLALPDVERAPEALAKALAMAGDVADWQGDQPLARAHFERALAIYRELDDRWRMASMLRGLGSSAIDRGEIGLALSLLYESLALAREVGHAWEIAATTNLIGTAVSVRGDFSTALTHHDAAAEAWRQLGDTGHVTTALASLAWVALLAHEWSRSAAAYREALEIALPGEDRWYTTWCVIGAGGLAAGKGDAFQAAELLGTGVESRRRLDMPLRPHVQAGLDQIVSSLRTGLSKSDFAAAWSAGAALAAKEAAARAFAVFSRIELEASREANAPYGLTRRERDVLRLLADGQADKAIADALFVARPTASKHVAAIIAKLGVESRTAAVAQAIRLGLV